ncbi:MAG: hypothetical protein LBS49_07080 [Candidatus Accumulibacter sp.]|jgi:hypothetical protein|nr:hypothetical protein [Accumulibacter sp.]
MSARLASLLPAALLSAVACAAPAAGASEALSVCFNYGCLTQAEVRFSDAQLEELGRMLRRARTPAEEREAIGEAVGHMLAWAGQQSPIGADRGGNYKDDAVYGKMDCIDHATTTTRLLRLLQRRGPLRFHRVLEPALRLRFVLFPHYSALIEELPEGGAERDKEDKEDEADGATPARFVVDSWFFDNGRPAAVMPLDAWLDGESPDDGG